MVKEDRSMFWHYLFFTFVIAWGTEFLLIAMYHFNLLSGNAATALHFIVIGFGAGMAPAYAAFVVKKNKAISHSRDFVSRFSIL